MSFAISSIVSCCPSHKQSNEATVAMLNLSQVVTGLIDLAAIVGITLLASLILANHAQAIHLPGLASFTNQMAYILLGTAASVILIDFIAFAIDVTKKFKALSEPSQPHNVQNVRLQAAELNASEGAQELNHIKKEAELLITQLEAKLETTPSQAKYEVSKEELQGTINSMKVIPCFVDSYTSAVTRISHMAERVTHLENVITGLPPESAQEMRDSALLKIEKFDQIQAVLGNN